MNVGSGGGAAAAPAGGAGGAAGGDAAPAEEAKEEKEEGMLRGSATKLREVVLISSIYREGGIRRGHGLRSLRLDGYPDHRQK